MVDLCLLITWTLPAIVLAHTMGCRPTMAALIGGLIPLEVMHPTVWAILDILTQWGLTAILEVFHPQQAPPTPKHRSIPTLVKCGPRNKDHLPWRPRLTLLS